jgi:ABC-type thiamin/hydroxymethylpyrimidine transport system permease subunit
LNTGGNINPIPTGSGPANSFPNAKVIGAGIEFVGIDTPYRRYEAIFTSRLIKGCDGSVEVIIDYISSGFCFFANYYGIMIILINNISLQIQTC